MVFSIQHSRVALAAAVAAFLTACNSSSAVPPAQMGGTAPMSALRANTLAPISMAPGGVNGRAGAYRPDRGDYSSGGTGQRVDEIPCAPTMVTNEYHVHFYLGVVYNGQLIADPAAIGMVDPSAPESGFTNTAKCYYRIHTHDASGTIHVELNKNLPMSAVYYSLQNVLDVWGVPHGPTNFGPYVGPIHSFVGNVPLKQTTVTKYVEHAGSIDTIPIRSHEAIFIEIGNTYYGASQLPSVTFYTEY